MKTLDRLQTSNEEINRLQDRVIGVVNPIAGCPLLDGRLVSVVLEPTGAVTRVAHGLGRPWVGWSLVDINAGVLVWRAAPSTRTRNELYLDLEQSSVASVDAKLWVF